MACIIKEQGEYASLQEDVPLRGRALVDAAPRLPQAAGSCLHPPLLSRVCYFGRNIISLLVRCYLSKPPARRAAMEPLGSVSCAGRSASGGRLPTAAHCQHSCPGSLSKQGGLPSPTPSSQPAGAGTRGARRGGGAGSYRAPRLRFPWAAGPSAVGPFPPGSRNRPRTAISRRRPAGLFRL